MKIFLDQRSDEKHSTLGYSQSEARTVFYTTIQTTVVRRAISGLENYRQVPEVTKGCSALRGLT